MGKQSTLKAITVLIIVALVSYLAWDNTKQQKIVVQRLLPTVYTQQITSTRTDNYYKYCPTGVKSENLISSGEIQSGQANRKSVSSQLGIDGNKLINKLARGNTGDAMEMITSNAVNIGMFVGAILLPFVVFLFIWPFLCCCCCCPSCCPSKCCQKADNELYTKCQLYWPAVTLILALLLVLSTSIYGFVNASSVGPSFKNLGCSLAVFTDNLLNGNVTTDKKYFFTGLYKFSSKLTDLNANLNFLETSLSDLNDTGAGTTYGYVQAVQTVNNNVKTIPDGAGSSNLALTYDTPINSAAPSVGALTSTFPAVLGKWDSASETLMSKLYNSISNAQAEMQAVKTSANTFINQKTILGGGIPTMQTTINSLANNVKDMDKQFGTFISYLSMPGDYGSMGMQGFYGFLVCFSFFSMVGVLLTVCCDKPGCRHLMYFSCVFLFVGAFLAFLVAFIFSLMVPFFTWTCEYLNVAVSSSTGFNDNFGAFLSSTSTDQISVCMPYGDGVIVSKVAGTAAGGLNNLTYVITSMKSFNQTTLKSYITGNLTELATMTNYYANGDISDLDTTNNEILRGMSYPSNSTNKMVCNPTFDTDSWVPSNAQNYSYSTAISCQVSTGTGNAANCDTSLGGLLCKGCMDTHQLLAQSPDLTTLTNALNSRYSAACHFNSQLQNTWSNYFTKKFAAIGFPSGFTQNAGTVMKRISIIQPDITGAGPTSAFTNIGNFRTYLTTLNTTLSGIGDLTDPDYGMLAGLNCKLFGQDFVTFQNVICGSFYNNMFIVRITFGIAAWGILFSMCCIVCTGVRHFKQIDKLKKIGDSAQDFEKTRQPLKKKK